MKYRALPIVVFTFMSLLFSCKNDPTSDIPEHDEPDKPIDEVCEIIDNTFSDLESYLEGKFAKDYSDKETVLSAVKEKLNSAEFVKNIVNKNDTCIIITFANGLQSNIIYDTSDHDYQINEDSLKTDDFLYDIPWLMEETNETGTSAFAKETTKATPSKKPLFDYLYIRLWEPFREENVTDTAVVRKLRQQKNIHLRAWGHIADSKCTLNSLCRIGAANSNGLHPTVIIISTHGRGGKILQTVYSKDDFNKLARWWKNKGKESYEISDLIIDKTNTKKRINIPHDYLAKNMEPLRGSIVFLNNCESTPITQLGLSSVFRDKGASTIFGYQKKVNGNICIQNTYTILSYMLQPKKQTDGEHSAFMAYRQKIPAENKINFWVSGSTNNNVRFSTKVYTQSPNTRSVIGMGALHLDYCYPTAGYDKVVCGLVYATDEENLYLDSEEKAGFVSTEVDHFVENGEDFLFSMENLKPKTTYYYRAFLAVRYPEGILVHYADDVCSFESEAEEIIDIPDPEFKRYLTTARRYRFNGPSEDAMANGNWWDETDVFIDADRDGEISASEADSIQYLSMDLESYDIHSLKGIERMPNLKYLQCSCWEYENIKDAIESIDLSENHSLRFLQCINSGIKFLDTSSCPELREIDCRNNRNLERIEVKGSSKLKFLHCGECPKLVSLDVSGMPALKQLICSRCNLRTLDVSECRALPLRDVASALNFGTNPISYLNVSGTGTEAHTGFDHIDIDISSPSADTLTIEGGVSLNRVKVSSNTDNSTACLYFPNCPGLSDISCSGSSIKYINVSEAAIDVNLSVSSVSEIKIAGGSSLKRFICWPYECPNLTKLDVSECPALEDLSCGGLAGLQELDISGCNMLKRLSCYELNLRSLDLRHCKSLIQLYARKCLSLESIELPYWISDISYTQWGEWHNSYIDNNISYGSYNPMIYVDGTLQTYEYRSSHQNIGSTTPPSWIK